MSLPVGLRPPSRETLLIPNYSHNNWYENGGPVRGPHRRHVHEPDPHLRAQSGKPLRLSHRTLPPSRRSRRPSRTVPALELPPDNRRTPRRRLVPVSRPAYQKFTTEILHAYRKDTPGGKITTGNAHTVRWDTSPRQSFRVAVQFPIGLRPHSNCTAKLPKPTFIRPGTGF